MQIEIDDIKSQVSSSVPGYVSTRTRSHISQVKIDGTIMGGINKQTQQNRNRNRQLSDRSVTSVKTSIIRRIGSVSENHQQPEIEISASNECDMNADTCCLEGNFIVL